jgi:hypothetical protein
LKFVTDTKWLSLITETYLDGPRCAQRLWTLLSSGHRAGVHSHVPLPWLAVGRLWGIGLAIGTSGGGGLARRDTIASAADVVLAGVATAITAIAVLL